ncbi:intraflagellar transport protein Oseg4 isoform X2 [Dermatophagoides farinae]|uniref:intraflagellar transport protein Oseg4 isoform X2 n=1 Tax=Dermatophagoides farinae TaxID=6954 RepID=UPI003F6026F6
MFLHLNKKISIPNCSQVRCIAWSWEHEFIACGGEAGMLKVIKLESNVNQHQTSKNDLSKNLSVNQTLESHKATVESVCWNEKFQKLTSSDANGTIIVWMFYKGMWYEEMVNNRQKSLVTGMAWTHDGNKICIVYEDGAIITGSVDGSRLWGKELKNISLNQVEWSPDGKIILIGTKDVEIHVFDHVGNFLKKMSLNHTVVAKAAEKLIAIKWFKNGTTSNHYPRRLIIAFDNGVIQLMRNESDYNAKLIYCEMGITSIEWNYNGDMFAVTGSTGNKNFIKIYNDQAQLLTVTKIPGNEVYDCSWEKNSRKLVLAVDSFMYFANLKCRISWCFLSNSIAFLRNNFDDEQKKKRSLMFWELKTNKRNERSADNFIQMACWHHYCVVVDKMDKLQSNNNKNNTLENNQSSSNKDVYCLNLYNSIGTLIDYHLTDLQQIKFCCMNSNRVIVASDNSFYVWPFKQLYNANSFKSLAFYSDNLYQELTQNIANDNDLMAGGSVGVKSRRQQQSSSTSFVVVVTDNDNISCVTVSEKFFIVGFESGIINQYLLPNASFINKIQLDASPSRMALNKNSTKLALTDRNSRFYLYDFEANNEQTWTEGNWIEISNTVAKLTDIWDFKWETDNNDLIVLLEKNKFIVINLYKGGVKILDPILFDGYLCSFQQLSIQTIALDQLIVDISNHLDNLDVNDYIVNIPSHYVNEIKNLIDEKDSITDAINYAVKIPELPSLWTIVSNECLKNLDIETAYLAMIKNRDYKGLQFLKRLNRIKDLNLKNAEVCAYQNHIQQAESLYLQELDRPDLAVYLNKMNGNFERVRTLLEKYNNLANHDKEMKECYMNLGEYYQDNYQWQQAIRYYEKINAYDQLAECYISEQKYDALVTLVDKVNDEKILLQMAMFLESLGFCKDSVRAYIRANNFEMATNACVKLSEWKMATELANRYKTKNVDMLLEQYIQHLETDHKYMEMIQVYRNANMIDKAVAIIIKLIDETKKMDNNDGASLLKKLHLLIGIIYEENKLNNQNSGRNNKHETLDELLSQNDIFANGTDQQHQPIISTDPWKGAEAYHFYLLTQRNLYRGKYQLAMNCALHLQDYEEYLTVQQIYSLLALAAYANKCYDICSKAFIKLESIDNEQQSIVIQINVLLLLCSSICSTHTLVFLFL